MKKFIAVLFVFVIGLSAFAAMYHSVPLSSAAYDIIDAAELRGIIGTQSSVRPYNWNYVKDVLVEIKNGGKLSASEVAELERVYNSLERQYGNGEVLTLKDVALNGFVRTTDKKGNNTRFGLTVDSTQKLGYSSKEGKIIDSRNSVTASFMGDLGTFLSYDLNLQVCLDKIDSNAYLYNEFKFDCGFYFDLENKLNRLTSIDNKPIGFGYKSESEMSVDVNDGTLSARLGNLKRDWGVGDENFGLSENASSFVGFDLNIKPCSWFEYSVLTGSLSKSELSSVEGVKWPSDPLQQDSYDNNLSIHRIEVVPFKGFKASIWESVVWRKRFELAYLNPLAIYMFAQNELSDFDNMLFGLDLSVNVPSVGRFYGAVSMDEVQLSYFIKNPRNELAVQAGYERNLSLFSFTKMNAQITYVPAFFYSHYPKDASENPFGNSEMNISYVNKGKVLGYPVHPDTLEFKFSMDGFIGSGWGFDIEAKDQMRSAQYAKDEYGTTVLTAMVYTDAENGLYYWRDFATYIWNNIFDAKLTVSKALEAFPVTFTVGLEGKLESSRSFTPKYLGNPVMGTSWSHEASAIVTLGCKIYY